MPSIDRYTENQYNDFGWARANNILTALEYSDLLSNYTGHKHIKDKYPITRFGETVIHSAQYTDVLMYVKGPIKNPQIIKVVRITEDNSSILNCIKEELLKLEREQTVSPFSFIRDAYGEGIFSIDRLRDYEPFQELQRRRKREDSTNDDNSNRAEQDGAGSTEQNKRADRAGPINGPASSLTEELKMKQEDKEFEDLSSAYEYFTSLTE